MIMKTKNQFLFLNNEYYKLDGRAHRLINEMSDLANPVASQEVADVVTVINIVRQDMVLRLKRATCALMHKLDMGKHVSKWKFMPQAGDVCDGKKFWITHVLVEGKERDLGSLSPTPRGDLGIFKSVFYDGVVMIPVAWLDDVTDTELDSMITKYLLKRHQELKRQAKTHQKTPPELKAVIQRLESIDLSK